MEFVKTGRFFENPLVGRHVENRVRVDNMALCGANRCFGKSNDVILDFAWLCGFLNHKSFAITTFDAM